MHGLISSFLFLVAFTGLSEAAKLVNFQVTQPPIVPKNAKQCTVKVLQRDFAFSYGSPEIVQLEPPTDCGPLGSWAAVTLNFTVTSNGTQYDRLGIFTFQNIEIWRTSTPEPTRGDGIIWNYVKDVTHYTPLFAKPGTFILQLDNLIQTGLDGVYSTVLYATYYASSHSNPPAPKADLIVPISNLRNDTGNHVSVPPAFSLNVTLPRNSVKVFAELYASGNGNEEFWPTNTPNQFLPDLPADAFLGQGPFREVRLLIDGQIAGVAYPYVTIFTGGFVPSMWRPISSYGALDLPTYFLDVTPFVPTLADGKPHNITIDVTSAEEDRTILQNWYLSGNLQVFVDKSSRPTTGRIIKYSADPYSKTNTIGSAANGEIHATVSASRKIHVESTIISGSGKVNHVVFTQDLQYTNVQYYNNSGNTENIVQTSSGNVLSTHNGLPVLVDRFSYPITVNYSNLDNTGKSWFTSIDHSYIRDLLPLPIFLRTNIQNHQQSSGYYFIKTGGNTGNGTNSNDFHYSDVAGHTYSRQVNAAYNNITLDRESGSLASPKAKSIIEPPSVAGLTGQAPVRLPHGRKYINPPS